MLLVVGDEVGTADCASAAIEGWVLCFVQNVAACHEVVGVGGARPAVAALPGFFTQRVPVHFAHLLRPIGNLCACRRRIVVDIWLTQSWRQAWRFASKSIRNNVIHFTRAE